MRKPLALAALAAVAVGCGGGIASCSDFYDQFAVAYCQKSVVCGAIGASEQTACVANAAAAKPYYLQRGVSPDDSVAMHRLAFDASAAQLCLDSFRRSECSNIRFDPVACSKLFVGLVQNGMPCQNGAECGSGQCNGGSPGCFGTCVAYVARGGDCSSLQAACDGNLDYCDPSTQKCVARGASGDACGPARPCALGLYCVNAACRGPSAAGEPCAPSSELFGGNSCEPGLFCDTSAPMPTCKARIGAGGACPVDNACLDNLVCVHPMGMGGVCTALLDAGAACDPAASACPADMSCDATTKKCVAPSSGAGAACSAMMSCPKQPFLGTPLYCDATMKCAAEVPLGDACTPPAMGEPNPCATGACDPNSHVCTITCK